MEELTLIEEDQSWPKTPASTETVGVSENADQSLRFPCEGLWVEPCGCTHDNDTYHKGRVLKSEVAVVSISFTSLLEGSGLEDFLRCTS